MNLARELTCRHGRYHLSCPVCKKEGHDLKYRAARCAPTSVAPGAPDQKLAGSVPRSGNLSANVGS